MHTPAIIKQYIRNAENDQPCGVLMACKDANGVIQIGWSKTHKNDRFNKYLGDRIAKSRMEKGSAVTIPFSIRYEYINFIERAQKYFKVESVRPYEFAPEIDRFFSRFDETEETIHIGLDI